MRGFDLGCGFGLQLGINRVIRDFVGFVNRSGLRLFFVWLLISCGSFACRLRRGFERAHAFRDPVKFFLKPRVRVHTRWTVQQNAKGPIEVIFRLIGLSGQRLVNARLVFRFCLCDQSLH